MVMGLRINILVFLACSAVFTLIYYILTFSDSTKYREKFIGNNKTCGRYPKEENIFLDNLHWQVLDHSVGFVNILNAYVDQRQGKNVIRVNVVSKNLNESNQFYCQFWYGHESSPIIVQSTDSLLIWIFGTGVKDLKYPYLIECPFEGYPPTSVSLVESPCDLAENNVKILDIQPVGGVKKRFGVCSKKARFDNRSFTMRFIEWVHMLLLLGAEKIHFSYEYVHPDLFEVIKYYEDKGIIETWEYLDPSGVGSLNYNSWQSYQLEVSVQTDCFYRVKNLYDFVVIIDVDELIMPVMEDDMTWDDIIKRANVSEYYDAYISQNVYYPEIGAPSISAVPNFMYMLQHVQRSQNFSGWGSAIKSIFGTERVLSIHTHMPHQCLNDKLHCKCFDFPTNISQNSHYRDHMDKDTTFNVTQEDLTIWKYKEQLIRNVFKTLSATNFVP